ncbi:hypothetical protein BH10PSE12_BH10PSE12_18780 [soil metagenome]
MLELRVKAGRRALPIFDLPALLGKEQAVKEIGEQVDALIAFIDDLGGEPDDEDGGDDEPDDDAKGDQSCIEWTTMRGSQKAGSNIPAGHEDEEDDDPREDDGSDRCAARDDDLMFSYSDDGAGDREDAEDGCDAEEEPGEANYQRAYTGPTGPRPANDQ